MTLSDSLAMLRLPRDSKNGLALPAARSRRLQAAHQRGSQTQEQGLLLAAAAGGGRGEPREAFFGGAHSKFSSLRERPTRGEGASQSNV